MSLFKSGTAPLAKRLRKGYRWIDERTDTTDLVHKGLYEAVPDKGAWAYTLGSAVTVLIILQLFTGIFLLLDYVPSFQDAWNSLNYLQQSDRFGAWVRGMHLWGAYVLILVVGLHMLRTFLSASYKKPRELNWITGAILFFLVLGLAITGAMLPMDNTGYWTAVVVTNIPHYIPFIGDALRALWRGGDFVGPITLTRTFAIHIWVLPFLLFGLIGAHIYLLRKHAEFGSWVNYQTDTDDPDKEIAERIRRAEPPYPSRRSASRWAAPNKTVPFFPYQLFKDTVVSVVLIAITFVMGYLVGAPFDAKADPATLTFSPTPEWFFLPLDQLLVLNPQQWLIGFGAIGVVGIGATLFILLPFLDRSEERAPLARPEIIIPGIFFALSVIFLALLGVNRLYGL